MILKIVLLVVIELMAIAPFFLPEIKASTGNQNMVTCEDGDTFLIKEQGIMETSNIPIVKGDLIIVDTRKFRLTLYRDGRVLRTYPVAIGEPETPTPIGEWKIIHKGGNWGGGFGVRWMGLNVPWGVYGIHGTNKPGSIGFRASHGCIRMYNWNILELYELVKLKTPVHIIGDIPEVPVRRQISRKNTGKDVVLIQFRLRQQNFNPGDIDGRFGEIMERAVNKLQYFYGLAITGKITPNEQYLLRIR